MTTTAHMISDALREVAESVQQAVDHGDRHIDAEDIVDILLSIADRLDPPVRTADGPPLLLDAARALLEARDNQMLTHVEWDALKAAVGTYGCEYCRAACNRPADAFTCPYCGAVWGPGT